MNAHLGLKENEEESQPSIDLDSNLILWNCYVQLVI